MACFDMRVFVMLLVLMAGLFVLAETALAHPGDHGGDDKGVADHEHDGGDHDPGNHSHPIGEDTHHQKASHGSFELAYEQDLTAFKHWRLERETLAFSVEPLHGIDLVPPVPPPLV
jgi:hypothetical protein